MKIQHITRVFAAFFMVAAGISFAAAQTPAYRISTPYTYKNLSIFLIHGKDETERYWDWLSGLEAVPVLTRFRADMEAIRSREFEDAMRRLKLWRKHSQSLRRRNSSIERLKC